MLGRFNGLSVSGRHRHIDAKTFSVESERAFFADLIHYAVGNRPFFELLLCIRRIGCVLPRDLKVILWKLITRREEPMHRRSIRRQERLPKCISLYQPLWIPLGRPVCSAIKVRYRKRAFRSWQVCLTFQISSEFVAVLRRVANAMYHNTSSVSCGVQYPFFNDEEHIACINVVWRRGTLQVPRETICRWTPCVSWNPDDFGILKCGAGTFECGAPTPVPVFLVISGMGSDGNQQLRKLHTKLEIGSAGSLPAEDLSRCRIF